jgi:uncharacterized metal-binding protein YceD (DUF177 family)
MKQPKEPLAEFSRPLEVARVPNLGSHEKISADESECRALAKRFQVESVEKVLASLHVKPWRGGGFRVKGEANITLTQQSVVSLENFQSTENFNIERYFLASNRIDPLEEELDIEALDGGRIDLGEIVAETIALELDPYPRKPGEVFADKLEDNSEEASKKPNPFNVIKLKP